MNTNNIPEILITVEGGVIQNVNIPKGANVTVKVRDFDVVDEKRQLEKIDRLLEEQMAEADWEDTVDRADHAVDGGD